MAYVFPMEKQQENHWCWAAVTVSVDHYFQPGSSLTQQELVGEELPAKVQLIQGEDIVWTLDGPLSHINRLRGTALQGRLTFEQLRAELLQGRPVCACIEWLGGGAHFVVISGFAISPDNVKLVYISDPLLEESELVACGFDDLASGEYSNGYAGDGRWVETYLTKP